jgi:hypothetical protein
MIWVAIRYATGGAEHSLTIPLSPDYGDSAETAHLIMEAAPDRLRSIARGFRTAYCPTLLTRPPVRTQGATAPLSANGGEHEPPFDPHESGIHQPAGLAFEDTAPE